MGKTKSVTQSSRETSWDRAERVNLSLGVKKKCDLRAIIKFIKDLCRMFKYRRCCYCCYCGDEVNYKPSLWSENEEEFSNKDIVTIVEMNWTTSYRKNSWSKKTKNLNLEVKKKRKNFIYVENQVSLRT